MTTITASNTIQYSSNSESDTDAMSPTKVKEFPMAQNYTGSWRIYFELANVGYGDSYNDYGQVYLNDAPYGYLQNNYRYEVWIGYSQDFTNININQNDKVQLYAWQDGSMDTVGVRNFRVEFSLPAPKFDALLIAGN